MGCVVVGGGYVDEFRFGIFRQDEGFFGNSTKRKGRMRNFQVSELNEEFEEQEEEEDVEELKERIEKI